MVCGMSEWNAKRFWKVTDVADGAAGWEVQLDGRVLRTPAKSALVLPTEKLARAIASEWDAQIDEIKPSEMPLTRTANSAIDKVTPQKAAVADMLAAYGENDLLCYRAEGPEALVARQAESWDPFLEWAAETLEARLLKTAGVIPVSQPSHSIARLRERVHALDAFTLAGFHDFVVLSGSLVLAFAALQNIKPIDIIWDASRIDEIWQEEKWGTDIEATEAASRKRSDFLQARIFLDLLV